MQLTCPECGLTKAREKLSWRLETCPECSRDGNEVYLGVDKPYAGLPAPAELSPLVRRFLERGSGPSPQH